MMSNLRPGTERGSLRNPSMAGPPAPSSKNVVRSVIQATRLRGGRSVSRMPTVLNIGNRYRMSHD
jgi:hypothetical protein